MVVTNPTHTRYTPMQKGNRLRQVRINGSRMRSDLIESCVAASVSASMSSVTELKFTFADDHDAKLFRSGLFQDGHVVSFAHWKGRIKEGARLKSARGGPQVQVTAPSLFVERLSAQTGERNWGETMITSWLRAQAESVGMLHDIENGIGAQKIVREKPDGDSAESTWDVMTEVAKENNCWLFEHSARLIVGRPGWVANRPWRTRMIIQLRWDSWGRYSGGLMGMPDFTPGPREEQKLKVRVTGDDAHRTCPGDTVVMSGNLNGGSSKMNANGTWIVSDVNIPLNRAEGVDLDCIRATQGAF